CFPVERGKGRQRQAILGEHPSSYSDNGYGSHCPLLPLPSNNRFKRSSHDVLEVVTYPLPQTCLIHEPPLAAPSHASSKTISGLLEFDSKTHAVEVLTVLNHYQIRIPSLNLWKSEGHLHKTCRMLQIC
ncbi:hypothetical protein cypCar_00041011, partial [Cyprinus carpio]